MSTRVAINGFGRIGRLVLRAALESGRDDLEFVAINDLGSVDANAHLLKHDSTHGTLAMDVRTSKSGFRVDGRAIAVFAERNPAELPWGKLGVDIVLECTGLFASKEKAGAHIEAGAGKVLVSAPADNADLTVVYGVNHRKLRKTHKVVSNASCTTNCLAPVAQVLDAAVGIESGFMTTIHAYTGDQALLDTLHKDLRRARAAAHSMIPTSTGAARAVGLVLPELEGKLDGTAIRVPTVNVSLIDLTFSASRKTTAGEVNAAVAKAAKGRLKGILGVNEAPLVSCDFNHDARSSVFDATQTQVIGNRFVRVLSWYDNEWGFSNRMLDTAAALARTL